LNSCSYNIANPNALSLLSFGPPHPALSPRIWGRGKGEGELENGKRINAFVLVRKGDSDSSVGADGKNKLDTPSFLFSIKEDEDG
jgi:hypothetical protein